MNQEERISEILKGAIDLHVHSGPGVIPRSLDHVEAIQDAIAAGMRGLVVKDQHSMTGVVVDFIKKYIIKDSPFEVFGGIVLNNATGGLSPHTVDAAITYGVKIVWMPTASAENHIEVHKKNHNTTFPSTKKKMFPEKPLTILDDQGKLLPQMSDICKLIAEGDVILGTGHLYLKEIQLLVEEAQKQGVKKILMQHPEFLIYATIDEMIEMAKKGVMIEHSLALILSGAVPKEYLIEMIKKVGAEYTTLGSDLGQLTSVRPIEGLRNCIAYMLDNGVTEEELDLMLRKNPAKLLNLD